MLREGGQWKKNEAEKKLNKQCIKLNSIKYGQACACMTSTESNNVQQLSRCLDMSFQHACMCNRNFFYPRFLALCHVQALCAMFTNAWIVYLLISKPASNNPTIRHSSHRRHTQTFHTFSSNLKRQLFNVSAWGIFAHIWKACCHTHPHTHTKHPPVRTIVHLERWEFRRSLPFSNIFSLRNGFERLHCLHSLCSFVSLETLVHPIQSKANQIFPTSTHISE